MASKVCLIRPPSPELLDDRIDPPIGLLQIATSLRQHGHEVVLLDFAGGEEPELPPAELYGMTLFTTSVPDALRLRDRIRAVSGAPIMAGGPHAQALPERTHEDFDYVVLGEAEETLPPLVDAMARRELPGWLVKSRAPKELGALPYNDYSLVDMGSYSRRVAGHRAISVLAGRGCPFRCTYCYTAALSEGLRLRPVDHVMGELHALDARYGLSAIRFVDDNFLWSRRFFGELALRLRDFGKPYRIYCRAADLTPECCQLLAWSGCRMVACGIESGCQRMHDAMNTRKSVAAMREGIIAAKRAGLLVRAGLIVGYPGETWDTVRESVAELERMPIDSYNLFNYVPLPGTDPYHHPEKYGITWISSDWKDFYVLCGQNEGSYAFEHARMDRALLKAFRQYMVEHLEASMRPALEDAQFR